MKKFDVSMLDSGLLSLGGFLSSILDLVIKSPYS